MKKLLAVIFALGVVALPAWGLARAIYETTYQQVSVGSDRGLGGHYVAPILTQDHDTYDYDPGPNVTLSSVAYPLLPNAGMGPTSLAGVAFAVVLLLGASITLYSHVKKAFAVVTR